MKTNYVALGVLVAITAAISGAAYYLSNSIHTFSEQVIHATNESVSSATSTPMASSTSPVVRKTVAASKSIDLLTFVTPQPGAQIAEATPVEVSWKLNDPSLIQKYPLANTYLSFTLISANGTEIGKIGNGYTLDEHSLSWDIAHYQQGGFYTLTPGTQYKIRATLQYQPEHFTCDPLRGIAFRECTPLYSKSDQTLLTEASQYHSESGLLLYPGTL